MNRCRGLHPVVGAGVAFLLAACVQLGPLNITAGRALYNEALQRTESEQLLLNIVRQRYNDPVLFLEVTSISSSSSRQVNANIGAFVPFAGSSSLSPGISGSMDERPLIFYAPNNGEKFVRQVLTPLDLTTLTLVLQGGWSIERVLLLAGDSVNDIRNSITGWRPSGGTPYQEYRQISSALRDLQRAGEMTIGVDTSATPPTIMLTFTPAGLNAPAYQTVCKTLAPACNGLPIQLRQGLGAPPPGSIATIATRSIYSAIYFLAEGVEVPAADAARGAAQPRNTVGGPLDPNAPGGPLFRVRTSPTEPNEAAVKVNYRGSWFYIPDNDNDSRVTFALLSMLLMLQAGETNKVTPLITLPAG